MNARRKLTWQCYPYYLLAGLLVSGTALLSIRAILTDAAPGTPWLTTDAIAWSLLCGAVAAAAGYGVIHHLSRSIERTREGARRFAAGDLAFRLAVPRSAEMAGLAETLNRMAAQLHERITTLSEERNKQQAMLGGMVEGVIAIDRGGRIVQTNAAAARLAGQPEASIVGRTVGEVFRNRNLQAMIEETLASGRSTEGEILHYGADQAEKSLQVYCTALLDAGNKGIGAITVLHDITRIRRLEHMRRDFVANVSHELKTPLTSIKGFAETLLDGALEDPAEARRFCEIIAKQVNRLQAIVEDLLNLSRIEQEAEHGQLALKPARLLDILQTGVQVCSPAAAEKDIRVAIDCDPDWWARVNMPLLEQLVVNLVDNAIKYSDNGREVSIRVLPDGPWWEIRFTDQGHGIEPHHLPRIFERFYRVDKARSRKVGGTGLGLSIVKHIVTSHGGSIRVESTPGAGSTFIVRIPRGDTVQTDENRAQANSPTSRPPLTKT